MISVNQQPDFNNLNHDSPVVSDGLGISFTDGQDIMARKELPGGTAAKAVAPPAGVHKGSGFPGRIGGPPSCISAKFGVNLK